ncbi:MAG: SH3 domain-containing protein [Anaerolinea sp.]|nr:SH3 domain-containing protein [Anaerolinea sp.]
MNRWTALVLLTLLTAGCSLTVAVETPTPAIVGAPVVQLAAPIPDGSYLSGVTVNIQVLVTNAGPDIARVDFAVDETIIASVENPNAAGTRAFSLTRSWTAVEPGEHTIRVTAYRGDGSASEPAEVAIRVVDETALLPAQSVEATQTAEPTLFMPTDAAVRLEGVPTRLPAGGTPQPEPTQSAPTPLPPTLPPPTEPPPTQAPTAPSATFTQGVNVRSGPSTLFNPPIGSFAAGQSTQILAVNPAGDWLKVRYYNGEGWVFASLATVTGDLSTLPRDPGPPLPTLTPIPPTVLPPTAPPAPPAASSADLVAGIFLVNPNPLVCNQASQIELDVANLGSTPTASGGTVALVDRHNATGTQTTTVGAFPVLQPGQTFRVTMFLTVSVYYEEDHTLTATINPDGSIPETTNSNNSASISYRLQRGGC